MNITGSTLIEALFISVLIYLASRALEWFINYIRCLWTYRKVKGLPIIPFIGNLHQVTNNGVDFLREIKEMSIKFKDAPIFVVYRAWQPVVFFHKSDHIDVT